MQILGLISASLGEISSPPPSLANHQDALRVHFARSGEGHYSEQDMQEGIAGLQQIPDQANQATIFKESGALL
jgi:hypothetical protein